MERQSRSGIKKRNGATRRKTGCFTCRSRHSRCDEKKPICSSCERLNLPCEFTEFIVSSVWCSLPSDVRSSKSRPDFPVPNGRTAPDLSSRLPEPAANGSEIWVVNAAESSSSHLSTPRDLQSPQNVLVDVRPDTESPPVIDLEAAELLSRYQSGVAVWMDLFDYGLSYQLAVVRRAFDSKLMLYSVCAFAAKQLSMASSGAIWAPAAARYYGEALRLLINMLTDPAAHKEDALTVIIILSSYEILAAPGDEHKRHLYGALTLIKTQAINARSKALERASFWIYVRQDVVMALINECPLLLSPEDWKVSWSKREVKEDALGNQMLSLLGLTINLVFQEPRTNTDQGNLRVYKEISEAVDKWFEGLPLSTTGVRCGMMHPQGFVRICFSGAAAAAAMLMYHLTKIMLLAESQHHINDSDRVQIQYHAEHIASIGFSDIPNAAFVQAAQPIYYAAKHINPVANKAKLWALLEKMETDLGFHTNSRVEKLRKIAGVL